MPMRLENLSSTPVHLVLASGDTLRISPGSVSEKVPDVEVTGSANVERLVDRGVIAVRGQANVQRSPAPPRRKGKAGGRGTNGS
jgi:hypothetical protein